jgi:crotonobetainyl-CoA:carnitine CoA-transferase CaiB-like acyl-CoA transferase
MPITREPAPTTQPGTATATGPLVGVRILDFSEMIAAPLATMLLSDMGAQVIKIEPLQGESWRLFGQFMPGESRTFMPLNRGKRDLAVDLKTAEGQAIVHELAKDSDVVVINYRPDVPARLKIDYATLSALNPRLIYVWNTAFGHKGPHAHRPGYDLILQAMSGLMSAGGRFDERGLPLGVGGAAVVDIAAGLTLAWAVCAALYEREKSGIGQQVDTSLFGAAMTVQASSFYSIESQDAEQRSVVLDIIRALREEGASYQAIVEAVREARGMAAGVAVSPYYRVYQTKDDFIAVACLNLPLRNKFLKVMGLEDPRLTFTGIGLQSPEGRAIGERLVKEAEALFRGRSGAEWLRLFDEAGVPAGPVRFADELYEDQHVVAGGLVVEAQHHAVGPVKMLGLPVQMSRTPLRHQGASPGLGQHTDEVLRGLGYDEARITALREQKVVR